jgi:predicted N-acyltransferase
MHDMFGGKYHDFLKDLKRKRKAVMRKRKAAFEDGASFEEAAVWLVAKWQHRMMPNI